MFTYQKAALVRPYTSEASSVRRVHGDHSLGHTGGPAHARLVQGPHPEDVGPALHQSCDWEAGVLHWDVIALGPVVRAHLAPAMTQSTDAVTKRLCQFRQRLG